jgi:hypothetical protein
MVLGAKQIRADRRLIRSNPGGALPVRRFFNVVVVWLVMISLIAFGVR